MKFARSSKPDNLTLKQILASCNVACCSKYILMTSVIRRSNAKLVMKVNYAEPLVYHTCIATTKTTISQKK